MAFLPCPSCRRHVRDLDSACPFCGHARSAASVQQARPRTRLPRGKLFAFVTITSATVACSGTSNPPEPDFTTDSGVADTATDTDFKLDSATASDTAVTDTGSAPTDSGRTDSGSTPDTATTPDTMPPDDDGGAAPLYGLPPPDGSGV